MRLISVYPYPWLSEYEARVYLGFGSEEVGSFRRVLRSLRIDETKPIEREKLDDYIERTERFRQWANRRVHVS